MSTVGMVEMASNLGWSYEDDDLAVDLWAPSDRGWVISICYGWSVPRPVGDRWP
jgi:hypothetical protein